MHTRTISELTDIAFAKDGPLHAYFQSIAPDAQWRREQYDTAMWYAGTLDREEKDKPEDKKGKPELSLKQIDPGIGKTLAYQIPMFFMVLKTGKRGLISTYTIQLRNQLEIEGKEIANKIVKDVCDSLGLPWRPVTIEVRESITGYASYVIAKKILDESVADNWEPERQLLAQKYFDWILDHEEDEITKIRGGYKNHKLPKISDWQAISDHRMPTKDDDTIIKEFSITKNERLLEGLEKSTLDIISPAVISFNNAIEKNFDSNSRVDVVVSTHAMFLFNNILFGNGGLYTRKDNLNNSASFGGVVVDEADLMHELSLQWTDKFVSVQDVDYFLSALKDLKGDCKAITRAVKKLNKLNKYASGLVKFDIYQLEKQSELDILVEIVNGLATDLTTAFDSISKLPYHIEERYNSLHANLLNLVETIDGYGSSRAEAQLSEYTGTIPYFKKNENGDILIGTKPSKTGWLPNRAWRNTNVHAYERFAFVSGTLTGFETVQGPKPIDGYYKSFKRRMGINDRYDYVTESAPIVSTHGSISKLVFCDPLIDDFASPSSGKRREGDYEEENTSGDFVSKEHCEFIAKAIHKAYQENLVSANPIRSLVLFPSSAALKTVVAYIEENYPEVANYPSLRSKIIIQEIGMKAERFIPDYDNRPDTFWFGHSWHGVNFVGVNRDTLPNRVIITKIPVSPANELMFADAPKGWTTTSFENASSKVIQGIGRAIRKSSDSPEIWILDPRLGIPSDYQRKAANQGVPSRPQKNQNWKKIVEAIPKRLYKNAEIGILRDHLDPKIEWLS